MLGRRLDELEAKHEARVAARREAEEFDPWAGRTVEQRMEHTAKTLEILVEAVGFDAAARTMDRYGYRLDRVEPGAFEIHRVRPYVPPAQRVPTWGAM